MNQHLIKTRSGNMFDGLFGDLFDFDGNGELDVFEESAEFATFMGMMEDSQREELASAGIDLNELEYMDDYEKREAISDAGLDPDEYDLV